MRPSRLLTHHVVQAPDDGASRRRLQRHSQSEGIHGDSIGGCRRIEVVNDTLGQGREGVIRSFGGKPSGMTDHGPIQNLQTGFQRRQSVRLRIDVLHLFYIRAGLE